MSSLTILLKIIWDAIVLAGCAYLVFEKGCSFWWWLVAVILCAVFAHSRFTLDLFLELASSVEIDLN